MGISYLSTTVAPAQVFNNLGKMLYTATCFLYKKDENWLHIVTNWHVVTGRDPDNPNCSTTGATPTTMKLLLHSSVGVPERAVRFDSISEVFVDLNSESGEDPQWLEHPERRFAVDVVVIRVANNRSIKSQIIWNALLDCDDFDFGLSPVVMDDVFVIGYPWGLSGANQVLPIYKRGSIASDPDAGHRGLPRFLIDCRTASGMSGSPVIHSRSGLFNLDGSDMIGTARNFTGVYSARLPDNSPPSNSAKANAISEIGIVWRKEVLDEIVENGVPGTKLTTLI